MELAIDSESPFRRSSVIARSPEKKVEEQVEDLKEKDTSPDALTKLGELISSLMEFVKTKNNVHHTIKEQVRKIRATYTTAVDELRSNRTGVTKKGEQATQTSPRPLKVAAVANKRSREQNEESPGAKPRKRRKQPSNIEAENINSTPVQHEVESVAPAPAWTKVVRKKNSQQRRTRPNALIISTKGEATYADILRKIKADPGLKDFGEKVRRIRRTQNGELLLEVNASSKEETGKFNELVEKSLDGSAEIRAKVSETLIECKDLDEVTTEADICAALVNQLNIPDLDRSAVKNIRKAYGGTQTARISLPDAAAQKALQIGKLKIGWSICRVREPVILKRCFRCLEFGHIAGACKSSYDRSKLCRKCGEANHIAKDCTSKTRCMFCVTNKEEETGHIAGSVKCPVFKKALSLRMR